MFPISKIRRAVAAMVSVVSTAVLPLGLAVLVLAGSANAAHAAQSGIFTYTDEGTTITIDGCLSSAAGAITIPATIAGKPVTRIANRAFEGRSLITGLMIPQGVTSIGYWSFSSCVKLSSLFLPSSITRIDSYAFSGCISLTDLVLPVNLASMGLETFYGCDSLTTVAIPVKLTDIGQASFGRCNKLASFSVAAGNTRYHTVGGVLFEKDGSGKSTLKQFPGGRSGTYAVPAGVVGLGARSFSHNKKITAVTLPSSVTTLEYYVFSFCDSLTSVNIPAGVKSTGPGLFAYCPKIRQVTLPAGLTEIGVNAFAGCTQLQELAIPEKVNTFGDYAFEGCAALKKFSVSPANTVYASVDGVIYNKALTTLAWFPGGRAGDFLVPSGVQSIGVSAFAGNPGLARISFPGSLVGIGRGAFLGCDSLNNVRFPASLATMGSSAFASCPALADVYFEGAAPVTGDAQFLNQYGVATTVHFYDGKSGFSAPNWMGYASVNMGPDTGAGPDIGVNSEADELVNDEDALGFNETNVGKVSTRQVTILNAGSEELWGLSVQMLGPHAGDYEIDQPGVRTLAPGGSITLQLRFKPLAAGTREATVAVSSNDRDESPFSFGLTGSGILIIKPEIAVMQPAGSNLVDGTAKKSFGTAKVGKKGVVRIFTVKNAGTGPLTVQSVTKDGTHAAEFTVSSFPKTTLPAGGSLEFQVTFKPAKKGTRNAAIHIKSNDADENPFDIKLTGMGAK